MVKCVFVILHYITIVDTVECVDSIINKCSNENYKIVVVDNGSPNKSAEQLMKRFANEGHVIVLPLKDNLGFAKGNNAGIAFAREKFNPEYIIIMNNDVLLLQDDTIKLIDEEFKKTGFSALGPMIYTADGRCDDNPGRKEPIDIKEIDNIMIENRRNVFLCEKHLWKLYRFWEWILKKIKREKESVDKNTLVHKNYLEKAYNVQLHGCFICFSKKYFECFDGLFPDTFLYLEEDILYFLLRKKNMVSVYLPELKIFHKEDAASKAVWSSDKERAYRKAKFVLQSANAFKKLYLTYGETK